VKTRNAIRSVVILSVLGAGTAALADDDEVPVDLNALPAAVTSAIATQWPGSTLVKAELEGKVYDVEFTTAAGEGLEAEVTAKGKIKATEAVDDDDEDSDNDANNNDDDEEDDDDDSDGED